MCGLGDAAAYSVQGLVNNFKDVIEQWIDDF